MKERDERVDELDLGLEDGFEPDAGGRAGLGECTLDAAQIMALLRRLEHRFDVRIEVEDIDLDDLRTLMRLADVLDEGAEDDPDEWRESPVRLAPGAGRFRA